jgi:ribosomal protein S18 acetylase RimI-like enzyme
MVEIRRGLSAEEDAAIAAWRAANPDAEDGEHADRLRQWSQGEDADLFVAIQTHRIVGMALLLPGRDQEGDGDRVPGLSHLTGVAVRPECRRQQVGAGLLDAALKSARDRGSWRVTLWARSDNAPAHGLFASRGFVPTGRFEPDADSVAMTLFEKML